MPITPPPGIRGPNEAHDRRQRDVKGIPKHPSVPCQYANATFRMSSGIPRGEASSSEDGEIKENITRSQACISTNRVEKPTKKQWSSQDVARCGCYRLEGSAPAAHSKGVNSQSIVP